jgi:hypothetical protein
MAEKRKLVKIFSLSHTLQSTVFISLMGDKYRHALPFDFTLTESIEESDIVAWDGVITIKLKRLLPVIEENLKRGKILFMMGEAQTLLMNHPFAELFQKQEIETVQLTGWSVLPEDMLMALESCYQKINHV